MWTRRGGQALLIVSNGLYFASNPFSRSGTAHIFRSRTHLFAQEGVPKEVVDGGGKGIRRADVIGEKSGSPDLNNRSRIQGLVVAWRIGQGDENRWNAEKRQFGHCGRAGATNGRVRHSPKIAH
jgi:hypothetical protein